MPTKGRQADELLLPSKHARGCAALLKWLEGRYHEADEMWPRFSRPEPGDLELIVALIVECESKSSR